MPKPIIVCSACKNDMQLVLDSEIWELEHDPVYIGDKAPENVAARKI